MKIFTEKQLFGEKGFDYFQKQFSLQFLKVEGEEQFVVHRDVKYYLTSEDVTKFSLLEWKLQMEEIMKIVMDVKEIEKLYCDYRVSLREDKKKKNKFTIIDSKKLLIFQDICRSSVNFVDNQNKITNKIPLDNLCSLLNFVKRERKKANKNLKKKNNNNNNNNNNTNNDNN